MFQSSAGVKEPPVPLPGEIASINVYFGYLGAEAGWELTDFSGVPDLGFAIMSTSTATIFCERRLVVIDSALSSVVDKLSMQSIL